MIYIGLWVGCLLSYDCCHSSANCHCPLFDLFSLSLDGISRNMTTNHWMAKPTLCLGAGKLHAPGGSKWPVSQKKRVSTYQLQYPGATSPSLGVQLLWPSARVYPSPWMPWRTWGKLDRSQQLVQFALGFVYFQLVLSPCCYSCAPVPFLFYKEVCLCGSRGLQTSFNELSIFLWSLLLCPCLLRTEQYRHISLTAMLC